MRLREIREIIANNYNKLNFDAASRGSGNITISNFQRVIDSVNNMKDFKFLETELEKLKQIDDIYYNKSSEDIVIVDNVTYNAFNEIITLIKLKCSTAINIIDESIPDQNENSISVKLPNYNDLSDLSVFFSELDKALRQSLVNDVINGKVELQNFDSGSYWVEIIIGGGVALNFVAGLTWTAAVIRKKFLEGELLKKKVESMGIKNEALEEISDALSKELEIMVDTESKQLLDNQQINYDPEFLGRVKFSVKTLAKLIYEGTEIHHSLSAPEEVKNLFPDFTKIEAIQSTIKQIE